MLKDKLKKFFSSEELSTELLECQTSEEVKKLFSENGIDISDDEMKILKDYINKSIETGGKLSEKELDEVSGGWSIANIVSTPTRVLAETLVELAYSPVEGWKKAVVNHRNKMREIESGADEVRRKNPGFWPPRV